MVMTASAINTASHRKPRRLSGFTRKAWLVTHIMSSGAWIGLDVVMAVLVFTAMLTSDPAVVSICYQALRLFAVWPLLGAGLVCLASGLVLGLGSKYGLIRYWWVVVKLGLNIVLTLLAVVALWPTVEQAARQGQAIAAGGAPELVPDLIFPPIVSPICLLIAVVLSVYKPWGRTPKGRA